ncbi:hypothetical protein P8625_01020 [Tenacibaculum tangerinum]|uniref:TonB C-terminal domain-containing protein n=1 Tax=Tenacibaculum tangerinum TaxID=3038772 RepID=A0ABY8L326_9FLAO|nr:hypothetical protein [Tenacibaculum tangerinum]WGH75775.1 hypothetical protein P8625_01020 [Tenacibaculum tangerinum]
MRIQFIILILFTNFVIGQKKVTIAQNVVKYETKDEFNRFDNIANELKKYKSFDLEINKNSNIKILNQYSTGFTGHTISFEIDNNLNIIESNYKYWTDVPEIGTEYKVLDIDLKLNQNPFKKTNGLRGQYEMKIEKVNENGESLEEIIFKGKFKSFKGIEKSSAEYLWALEQNNIFYGITNENGVYLRPDKMPSLKSDHKILSEKIKKIKGYKPEKIKAYVVINENGKIEKEPFRFFGNFGKWSDETQSKVKKLLIELTEWYPACMNEKEVKSQIPIIIGTE